MNKIDLLYDKTDWRPSMVMAANEDIVRQGLPVFSKTSIPTFINSKFLTTRFFLANTKLLPTRYVTDVMLHFSQEIGHYYLGGTITYPAIQLAAQLGYKQIGIVGLDHHFPVMNASPDQRVRLDQDDDNHFDNTYFKGKTWQPPNLRMNELHYSFAKSHLTEKEITIVNCSTQSKLDVFQRHTLNTFLNGEA